MMNGPKRARHWVTDYLSSDVPSRLIPYRAWWSLDDTTLPNPTLYLTYEPVAIDHWPMIYTVALATQSITREDYDYDSNPKYEVRMAMRTYIWAKGETSEGASDLRDDLTTVVRDAFLDGPAVSGYNQMQTDCSGLIDEGTIREEFSDLTPLKGERMLAGAYIQYDLVMTEVVTRDLLGSGIVSVIPTVMVGLIEKVPNAPTLLLTVDGAATEVDMTWRAPTWDGGGFPLLGYKVEQSEDDGDNWTVSIADTGTTTPTATVTGLTTGEVYLFRVSAINENGTGAASAPSAPTTAP